MRIVVCVRQVYDPATVRISRSREELDLRGATRILNRPDRYALEAAFRLREAAGGEVIALTVGGADAEDTSREAVALGADRAMLVCGAELAQASGNVVARAVAAGAERLQPVDLLLTGPSGLVDGTGALAGRLSVLLGWPLALDALELEATSEGVSALVNYDGEGRRIHLSGPAVVSILPGPRRPRYAHATRIANAWRPGLVEVCTTDDLGLSGDALAGDTEAGGLVLGPERQRGEILNGSPTEAAGALLDLLRGRRVI